MRKALILTIMAGFFTINTYAGKTVLPSNSSWSSTFGQLGNTASPKCDGKDPKMMKLTILPSVFGKNLRGGGNTLSPRGEPIVLELTITNGGTSKRMDISFPSETTFPHNYGTRCSYTDLGTNINLKCITDSASDPTAHVEVSYKCQAITTDWFLNDYLDCDRIGDPAHHGSKNKEIECLYFYKWDGPGRPATESYHRQPNIANCGIEPYHLEYGPKISVTNTDGATLTKTGKRGYVNIIFQNLSYPHQNVLFDMTSGKIIKSGPKSIITTQVKQGTKYLTNKTTAQFDEFEQCLTVKTSMLGENLYGGSYYSPLILFFGKERPQYLGQSSFPLIPNQRFINWVEPHAPGYFLAIDKYGNKTINNANQLFGNTDFSKNGFEALKKHDKNHDGVIDRKDPIFKKLILWNDKNGNGLTDKGEVFKITDKGVISINLKYDKDKKKYVQHGPRAISKERSTFTYKQKGKIKKGEVVDVWFSAFKIK